MTDSSTTTRVTDAAQLGQQIRQRRKQLGLTQADAAALCGVGNRFLSDLENGKATAHIGKAFAVLNGMGLDMHVGPRGQLQHKAVTLEARAGVPASARLQRYLDELNRYDLPKLPGLTDRATRLAQQVAESQQELAGHASRMAEQLVSAQMPASEALKSATAQIEELQNRLKYPVHLPGDSDD